MWVVFEDDPLWIGFCGVGKGVCWILVMMCNNEGNNAFFSRKLIGQSVEIPCGIMVYFHFRCLHSFFFNAVKGIH